MTPLCRRQCNVRQDLLRRVVACNSELQAALARKHAAAENHDIEEWTTGDCALIGAHARRDEALQHLVEFDSEVTLQTQDRLGRIREAIEEAFELVAERTRLWELWQHPSEGDTPSEAVGGEIAWIDGNVLYESRRTIIAGLEALEEMCESKRVVVRTHLYDNGETPKLDGMDQENGRARGGQLG